MFEKWPVSPLILNFDKRRLICDQLFRGDLGLELYLGWESTGPESRGIF